MTDIVERLRLWEDMVGDNGPLFKDAADEIERLQAEIETFRREMMTYAMPAVVRLKDENARLRAALEPFARNTEARSLSEALGHVSRGHLLEAHAALHRS